MAQIGFGILDQREMTVEELDNAIQAVDEINERAKRGR